LHLSDKLSTCIGHLGPRETSKEFYDNSKL
jgi:hypothetical protein